MANFFDQFDEPTAKAPDRPKPPDAPEPGAMTRHPATNELIRWNGKEPRPSPAQSRRFPVRRCDA